MKKWYESLWFIILSLIIFFPVGIISACIRCYKDNKRINELNTEVENLKNLNGTLEYTNNEMKNEFEQEKSELKNKLQINDELKKLRKQLDETQLKYTSLVEQCEMVSEIHTYELIEKELSVLQVGLLKKDYDFEISEEYKDEIKKIQKKQAECIKNNNAISIKTPEFLANDNQKTRNKVLSISSKLILRAFNNECDAVVAKVNHKNVENSRKRIENSFNQINKLGEYLGVMITLEYYKLKIAEIQLAFEYEVKRQEELEEQRIIREQIREEAKVQAEITKLEKEALKEEALYNKALEKIRAEFEEATESQQIILSEQIRKLEESLKLAEDKMQRAKSMAEQTKSGFVYIISNIGSFGDNIYKIGMTRRLDPQERINELSNASVPFPFDVHATIYTHNAPELESKLHQAFDHKRVNKVNNRKEFFNSSLDEIVDKVNEIHGEIKLTKQAEAYQYRQSIANTVE